jgi:hypothetical protein
MRILLVCAVLLSGCYATRPPTTGLAVVNEVPADAVRVGPGISWMGTCDKAAPTPEAFAAAEARGANYLVLEASLIGCCYATPYAIR